MCCYALIGDLVVSGLNSPFGLIFFVIPLFLATFPLCGFYSGLICKFDDELLTVALFLAVYLFLK